MEPVYKTIFRKQDSSSRRKILICISIITLAMITISQLFLDSNKRIFQYFRFTVNYVINQKYEYAAIGTSNHVFSHPYNIIINHPEVCPHEGENLKLLAIVTSAPTKTNARNAIRDTWGAYVKKVGGKVLFLLGVSKESDMLQKEDLTYHDIIQSNFTDSYNNLTIKTQAMMKWIKDFCPKVKTAMKSDDDTFFNIDLLMNATEKSNLSNAVMGLIAVKSGVVRDKKSKWYVSMEEYDNNVFPDFARGPIYLFSGKVAKTLYEKSLDTPFFYLEDVYITGFVGDKVNLERINDARIHNVRVNIDPCMYTNYIGSHYHSLIEIRKYWEMVHNTSFICAEKK